MLSYMMPLLIQQDRGVPSPYYIRPIKPILEHNTPSVNSSPNKKILGSPKIIEFADEKCKPNSLNLRICPCHDRNIMFEK